MLRHVLTNQFGGAQRCGPNLHGAENRLGEQFASPEAILGSEGHVVERKLKENVGVQAASISNPVIREFLGNPDSLNWESSFSLMRVWFMMGPLM